MVAFQRIQKPSKVTTALKIQEIFNFNSRFQKNFRLRRAFFIKFMNSQAVITQQLENPCGNFKYALNMH